MTEEAIVDHGELDDGEECAGPCERASAREAGALVTSLVLDQLHRLRSDIRKLHQPSYRNHRRCRACGRKWPCPTIRLLDTDDEEL